MRRIIRPAVTGDIERIMPVFEAARAIMRSDGNMTQWSEGYPSRESVEADIRKDGGFVFEEGGRIVGYFAFLESPEPTYDHIEGGEWLDKDAPYHVIHRIASYPDVHGIFSDMMDYCFERDANIRIDTHRNNSIMRHNILKWGFSYRGIIYLASGDERLAYQRIISNP
ncbi:MAG: N-acetyltransferase [Bacteroidales bacterium]|nr:N-acetyltransferase [Bacteroidales bacterium]